jgi:enoyl-CoA hydratase
MNPALILSAAEIVDDPSWLRSQSCPVIVYGTDVITENADVLTADLKSAHILAEKIAAAPLAAMTLVQVLRSTERLPTELGLDVESLAYSTLQSGPEFQRWLRTEKDITTLPEREGPAILLQREGSQLEAILNRAELRNSVTVEMRDAWVETLELLEVDDSIEQLILRGLGPCFSTGGELAEFGSAPDPAVAHWVRSVRSPARMMAKLGSRITAYVHGACIGSGIELPAFSARMIAHSKTHFQLPELKLGLIPGAGGTVSLTRRIGRQKTAWLVLSGRRINAKTALEWGLVDEIQD